jgi:MFS transporter, CP family, cyanate transporter
MSPIPEPRSSGRTLEADQHADEAAPGSSALPALSPVIGSALAVTAIVLVALGLRPSIVSVGPVLPAIISTFHLSHAGASLLTSIPDVLMGLLALPTPWLALRFGRDPVLLLALVLLFVSTVVRALSGDTTTLLLTTTGVGAGIAIAGALIAGFIKARFPGHAAKMMGLYATALSLGSTLSAAVTGPVSAAFDPAGWRVGLGIWAFVILVGVGAWIAVTRAERRHHAVVPAAPITHRLPLRNRTAWRIALFFACVNLLFYALLAWTSPMYREAGLSATTSGLILASFTAVFTIANPIFGWLSRSQDRRGWLAFCSALCLAGLLPIAIVPAFLPFLFIALCAFGLGGTFTLGMTLPLDNTHSVAEANLWNAFVLTVGYLIAATGPLLVGYFRDVTGDFALSFWFVAAVAAVMLALTPFLGKGRDPS